MPEIKQWKQDDRFIEIDLDLCTASAACVDACPADVYQIKDGKVNVANLAGCVECGACQDVCPGKAILKHWAWES